MMLVDVCSCGTRLERMKLDGTACMPCDGMCDGSGSRPHVSALEGCRANGAIDMRRSHKLSTLSEKAGFAGARHRLAEHAVLGRKELSVPRQDSYTTATFESVAAMVRMRAVDARGDGVFRNTDLTRWRQQSSDPGHPGVEHDRDGSRNGT